MSRNVDLLPPRHFTGQLIKQRAIMWLFVAGASVVAVGGVSLWIHWKASELESKIVPLRQNVAASSMLGELVAPLATKLEAALGSQAVVKKLLDEPFWNGVLSDIGSATEGKLYITRFDIWREDELIDAESDQKREVAKLRLSGEAPSNFEVVEFMRNLALSHHLAELDLVSSDMSDISDRRRMGQFEIVGVAR